MTIEQLKELLRRYHLSPNKTLGQNFLLNDVVLQDMVDSVPLQKGEAVLEIGPGIGNLTEPLLRRADFVLAVEKDKKFEPLLRALKRKHKNLRYEIADILSFDFQRALAVFPTYHVVANIPYYITGKIIQMLLRAKHKPKTIILLVQKEVAQNLIAKPGNLNLLAISVQLFGEVKLLQNVLARDFYPSPKVGSAMLQITLSDKPRYDLTGRGLAGYDLTGEKKFFKVLRACFAGKRKQIHNTLVHNLGLDKNTVPGILERAGISPQARPQELAIEQWLKLVKAIV